MSKYIWKFITFDEYSCNCCGLFPPEFYHDNGVRKDKPPAIYQPLFESFELIRLKMRKPIIISCGYRCPKHNEDVGGKALSVHLAGLALDLDLKDKEEVELVADLIKDNLPDLRMGIYKNPKKVTRDDGKIITIPQSFIHIDTGYLIHPKLHRDWIEGVIWNG